MVSISTLILIVFLFFHMKLNYSLSVEVGKTEVGTSIFRTKFFRSFILEVLLNLIHAPPGVDAVFELDQLDKKIILSLDTILCSIMVFRIYLGLRLFAHYTKWRSELAVDYCEAEGCEANTLFALKALLKESPYLSLFISLILSSWVFGFTIRNFERPLNDNLGVGVGQDFKFIWNGMWLAVVTMTTVGFGDFFAQSHFGRIITVLVIFWGIFLVSMMVVTLTNSMTLDAKETRAFNILYRLKSRRELKNKAAYIITTLVRIRGLDLDFDRRNTNPKIDDKIKAEFKKEYEELRTEYLSKIDIYKGLFIEEKKNLKSADTDPVEEIRKLSLAIDQDFDELRQFLVTIKEIEANLESVMNSHRVVLEILNECKKFSVLFEKEILNFKGGIFNIEKYTKSNQ